MTTTTKVSISQACKSVGIAKSTYLYRAIEKDDSEIITCLESLIEKHPSIGFWMSYYRIRAQGYKWNHKRVYRVYTALKLNIRRRAKKRLPSRVKQELFQPQRPNQVWSLDFMSDSLWSGKRFRVLNVIDDYNREILAIEPDTSLPTGRVIRVLEMLKETRGLPEMIRSDNGPEFISQKLDHWAKENKVRLIFIQPGSPTQNAYIERFNGSLRRELFNAYIFKTISEVKQKTEQWMIDYNQNRPHKALNYKTPWEVFNNFVSL